MSIKRTIIILADGLGISPSWNGNAISLAKPKTLDLMMNTYPHLLVKTVYGKGSEGTKIDNARLLNSTEIDSDKAFIDSEIESGNFFKSSEANSFMDEVAKKSGALHLIGHFPSSNGFSSKDHLRAISKMVRQKKIVQTYLHLIVPEEEIKNIERVDALTEGCEFIEIASLINSNTISDQSPNKAFGAAFKDLLSGRAQAALTPEQALTILKKNSKNVSLRYRGGFNYKVKDFDSVLFFDHQNQDLKKLVSCFCENTLFNSSIRFIEVGVLFNSLAPKPDKLSVLCKRNFVNSLVEKIADNCPTLWLSNISGMEEWQYLFGESGETATLAKSFTESGFENDLAKAVFDQISDALRQDLNEYEVIFLHLPFLSLTQSGASLEKIKDAISEFDNLLSTLHKWTHAVDLRVFITSSSGGLERIAKRDDFEKMNNKTRSFVPLLLVEQKFRQSGKRSSIYDMIREQGSVLDVAPTILDVIGLPAFSNCSGQSLKSKLLRDYDGSKD